MTRVVPRVIAVCALLRPDAGMSAGSAPFVGSGPLVRVSLDLASSEILAEFGRLKPPEARGGYFIWGEGLRHFLTKGNVELEANFELETGFEFELPSLQLAGGTCDSVGWRNGVLMVSTLRQPPAALGRSAGTQASSHPRNSRHVGAEPSGLPASGPAS